MARPRSDEKRAEIFKIADGMLRDGITPTTRKVRAALGWGSQKLLTETLRCWRESIGSRLGSDHQQEISQLRKEIETLTAEHEGTRRHLMLETDRMRQQMSPELATMRRKLEKTEGENFLLSAKVARLTSLLQQQAESARDE